MEKCKQITTKNRRPRKNNVEVTVEAPTKPVILLNKSIQIDITDMLKEIQKPELDVVIGSRFLKYNGYKTTVLKKLGTKFFGFLASLITGQKVTDPTSGFQALKGDVIDFMSKDLYPPDYPDADVIILLHRAGFKVKEIPVKMRSALKNSNRKSQTVRPASRA